MISSYKALIEAKCQSNPALLNLQAFLSASAISPHSEQIISQKFFSVGQRTTRTKLTTSQIAKEVHDNPQLNNATSHNKIGQILIVENISKETMAELGSCLDIDPMFFASHIHSAWRNLDSLSPKFCELPSQTKAQNFATFPYHRSLVFPDINREDYKLLRLLNIRRKVIVLPPIQGRRIGLAQHCCSVMIVPGRKNTWLGLVLVDSPMQDNYISFRGKQEMYIKTPCTTLFHGTPEGLQMSCIPNLNTISRDRSLLEKLLESWESSAQDFAQNDLNLKTLSYYPLRLIATEWVNYIEVVRVSLRNNSSPPSNTTASPEDLERIKSAVTSASSWPRRVASSTVSLRRSVLFIKKHSRLDDNSTNWEALRDDYEYITASLVQHGEQLQTSVLSVTMFLQLLESRRVSSETKHVSRLTVLALTFVPLSFVSSLFSMNEVFSPGGPLFWVYFVVATPLLITVFILARSSQWGSVFIYNRVKGFPSG